MLYSIFCLADTGSIRAAIVDALRAIGRSEQAVSFLEPGAGMLPDTHASGSASAVTSPVRMGEITLAGFGPVTAYGPLLTVLRAASGATTDGCMTTALDSYGIPASDAQDLELHLPSGQSVVAVHDLTDSEADAIGALVQAQGAHSICAYADPRPLAGTDTGRPGPGLDDSALPAVQPTASSV